MNAENKGQDLSVPAQILQHSGGALPELFTVGPLESLLESQPRFRKMSGLDMGHAKVEMRFCIIGFDADCTFVLCYRPTDVPFRKEGISESVVSLFIPLM